jgi:hypothetical protein
MKAIRSLREMTRILNTDLEIRKLCLIKDKQKGYTRSVISRFSKRVGQDNLSRIIDQKVIKLLKNQQSSEVDVVLEASFIKAWSTRHPTDNQKASRILRSELADWAYHMHWAINCTYQSTTNLCFLSQTFLTLQAKTKRNIH